MGNKIKNFFVGIWERINQIDIPDGIENLTSAEKKELDAVNKAQGDVHEQRSFAQRVKVKKEKADPVMAKFGPLEGNPIRNVAERMNEIEEKRNVSRETR